MKNDYRKWALKRLLDKQHTAQQCRELLEFSGGRTVVFMEIQPDGTWINSQTGEEVVNQDTYESPQGQHTIWEELVYQDYNADPEE